MPTQSTFLANLCLAFGANTITPANALFKFDVLWFNPFAAVLCGAVESIFCGVFVVFFVPSALERVVEQSFDVL